ncbi:MAG: SDR family NAD(P)-dependent oxidoreductase [Candidatus Sulfotelmatobacter sp.]
MNMSFENKVALVTGAAAGMGLATARAFAQAGAAVVLADFKEEVVRAEAQKLTAAGYKAMAISGLYAIPNPRAFSLSN